LATAVEVRKADPRVELFVAFDDRLNEAAAGERFTLLAQQP
jgi:hypothetical protein